MSSVLADNRCPRSQISWGSRIWPHIGFSWEKQEKTKKNAKAWPWGLEVDSMSSVWADNRCPRSQISRGSRIWPQIGSLWEKTRKKQKNAKVWPWGLEVGSISSVWADNRCPRSQISRGSRIRPQICFLLEKPKIILKRKKRRKKQEMLNLLSDCLLRRVALWRVLPGGKVGDDVKTTSIYLHVYVAENRQNFARYLSWKQRRFIYTSCLSTRLCPANSPLCVNTWLG